MKINNRRYIGCKQKLIEAIFQAVQKRGFDNKYSFADLFAGTGVVANYFAKKGYDVLLNDTLYSNYICYKAWLGAGKYNEEKVKKIVCNFNTIDINNLSNNYFSNIYGDKYFNQDNAKLIGYIRDELECLKSNLSEKEYSVLLTSLMYSADKVANTVGHYESFLKNGVNNKKFKLEELEVDKYNNKVQLYNEDANVLARNIKYDIIYLDPPYNARQYVNFYHVLENLARWEKPVEFEGNSMKFKRQELKSDYCRSKAPKLFNDLIESLDCKLIVVSYNNTYSANSISSNNTIKPDEIISSLEKKGKVEIIELEHNFFNAGKTDFKDHKELLYICEVGR